MEGDFLEGLDFHGPLLAFKKAACRRFDEAGLEGAGRGAVDGVF